MADDGKYQKQNRIGSGERVDVFLGLNVAFDRKVAIKELRGGIETSDAERNSFYKEYEKWAKLEHGRIARIADIDKTRAWVIQEYLPQSIHDLADGFRKDNSAAYRAMEQLFEGLEYLHAAGFLHCNIKASNVRFAGGDLKLCDGRCVQIGFPGSLPKPRGSNLYLAPEMINEEFGSVGTATDIYIAGMVLLQTLAGDDFEELFKGYVSGTPDKEMGWVRWHNSPDALEPIHSSLPSIPQPIAEILDGMLCKEVRIRHSSAERLLMELRAVRDSIVSAPSVKASVGAIASAGASSAAPGAPRAGSAGSAPAPAAPQKPKQIKLIDRPVSPVYVRCLSGALAGSIFPLPMGKVIVGTTDSCNVKLSAEKYPSIQGREVHISLGNNGWQIKDPQSHPLIVDLKKSFEPMQIRSGSIFRLSASGPDFQFVVQGEHDWTWQDISSELNLLTPEPGSVPDRLLKTQSASGNKSSEQPTVKQPQGNRPSQPTPAQPRQATAASSAPPPPPPKPLTPREQKKEIANAKKAEKAAAKAGARAAAPAPASAPAPATQSAPGRPVAVSDAAPKESMIDKFKNMDQSKRNNLILIFGLPLVALLVILFVPRSKSDDKKDKDESSEVQTEDGEKQPSAEGSADTQPADSAGGNEVDDPE